MGTHPIFESDFDCLTECCRLSRSNFGETKPEMQKPEIRKILNWRKNVKKRKLIIHLSKPIKTLNSNHVSKLEHAWNLLTSQYVQIAFVIVYVKIFQFQH